MNIRLILHFAKILALSSVRAQRMKGSVPTGFAKSPKLNLIIGFVGFLLSIFLTNNFAGSLFADLSLSSFTFQIAIFLPSLMTLTAIMYGLLFEFNQSSSVGSSDIINWLPIHPLEFVIASVFAMLYFLAPILGIVFGASLGLALSSNMLDVGFVSLILGILGLFLGSFILEIIRAITNRVSSSVYKRTGKTAIVVRMAIFITIFIVFMLVSNVNFLFSILQQFMGGIEFAWFIPILWPSLTILNYLSAEILQMVIYGFLSLSFTIFLLWISVNLRKKYWVPSPFAIKLESKPYTPKKGLLGSLGFTLAESALIKKDFRSLTRRKEMLIWIAVPLGISIISLFSVQSSLSTATTTLDRLTVFWGPLMGLLLFAFYVSLTSIGQEGSAFLNLQIVPLKVKEIAKAKISIPIIASVSIMLVVVFLIQLIVQPRLEVIIAIAAALFAIILECSFVGLAVGSRFPDFSEVPRARFIDQKGVWLGFLIMGVCIVITILPLFLYSLGILWSFSILIIPIPTAISGFMICYVAYQQIINNIHKLTSE